MESESILVLDNRVNVSEKTVTAVTVSGVQITQIDTQNAEGNNFNSSIIFNNITTPSISSTLVSRRARIRYTLTVGAAANPPILVPAANLAANGGACALRAFPLQSICDNISLILNGSTTNINQRVIIPASQRRIAKDYLKKQATECPSMADNAACLNQDRQATALTSQQPLSSYYNSDGTTRASFQPVAFDNAAHTFTYIVSEPLLVSPLSLHDKESYIALVNTLSLQLNYTYLNDMFVFALGAVVPAGFAVTITDPKLELEYIQVGPEVSIPPMVTYPYENLVYFNRALPPMAATNAAYAFTAQSDTLRFSAMPDLIYVFVRPQITGRTSAVGSNSQADCFFSLAENPNLSITLGTRSGLMSSANAKTLYEVSVANGYNSSWNDWSYGSGSLLIISPTLNLGLNLDAGDIAVGQSGSVNFQIQGNWTNTNFVYATGAVNGANIANLVPELVVIPVFSGKAVLTPSNCVFSISDLSENELMHLLRTADEEKGTKVSSEALAPTIKGGSLFGSMKRILSKVAQGVQQVASHPVVGHLAGMSGGLMTGAGMRRRR